MTKIKFREVRLSKANKERLDAVNEIIKEYQADGYTLTLRQLYYQLVSRDVIPNKQAEYSKLSTLLKEGRMGGIVDWDAIEDRLRRPSEPSSWDSPKDAMEALISQYQLPRMSLQKSYIEVWVEKDALSGVLKRITEKYHIPILVNRGYSSVSAMYDAYRRFAARLDDDKEDVIIFYLGDFDPSGMDMIRDVEDRIKEFAKKHYTDFPLKVIPIALTREQIKQYNPPPNPAKLTDPRAKAFVKEHGGTSWEVDALPPNILNSLLEEAILDNISIPIYEYFVGKEEADKDKMRDLSEQL